MKLRTKYSFRLVNKSETFNEDGIEVGLTVIHRVKPFDVGRPTYWFYPNEAGEKLGLKQASGDLLKKTLNRAMGKDN